MKFAFIVPTAYISRFGNRGSFHLALSHLCDKRCKNQYSQELLASKLPIYLDNGTYENGVPEEAESLLHKAEKLGAEYVFAPDFLYDANRTLAALNDFCKLRDEKQVKVKVAAVVQASSAKEYVDFYRYLSALSSVELLGLSILAIPYAFSEITGTKSIAENRIEAMRQISEKVAVPKKSHLLGLGDGLSDVCYALLNCPWIDSNDSSSAFQNGLEGRTFNRDTFFIKKSSKSLNFATKELTSKREAIITKNINFITTLYGNSIATKTGATGDN